MGIVPNSNAGQRVSCSRCAKPCKVADTRKTDARVAIESNGPGLCAECISTAILKDIFAMHVVGAFDGFKPAHLRLPHIQRQMEAVIAASGSRMPATALDWDEVIANWDLPIPKKHKDQLF